LILERKRPNGPVIHLEGQVSKDVIQGNLDWVGDSGKFELLRSYERISKIAPEKYAGSPGMYRMGLGRTAIIDSRFRGELLFTDISTGRQATLFPMDTDLFFIGPGLYLPSPVSARLRFLRDKENNVTAKEGSGSRVAGISFRGRRAGR
jgi:hypothetical protein